MFLPEPLNESLEPARLHVVIAAGMYESGEFIFRKAAQLSRGQLSSFLEVIDSLLRINPGGRLREYRADDYFERLLCRPPVLRAVLAQEPVIDIVQNLVYRLSTHDGALASSTESYPGI